MYTVVIAFNDGDFKLHIDRGGKIDHFPVEPSGSVPGPKDWALHLPWPHVVILSHLCRPKPSTKRKRDNNDGSNGSLHKVTHPLIPKKAKAAK